MEPQNNPTPKNLSRPWCISSRFSLPQRWLLERFTDYRHPTKQKGEVGEFSHVTSSKMYLGKGGYVICWLYLEGYFSHPPEKLTDDNGKKCCLEDDISFFKCSRFWATSSVIIFGGSHFCDVRGSEGSFFLVRILGIESFTIQLCRKDSRWIYLICINIPCISLP